MKYILAIDQGTTGSTALILNEALDIIGKATEEFPQHFPMPSWVEHDLDEIWRSVETAVSKAISAANVKPHQISAIGITNQRETVCLWHKDRKGSAFGKAIVWQDRRTAEECARLKKKGLENDIHKKTGLLLDPYFSATKLAWRLKQSPENLRLAKAGKICFGTIDSFLLYRLTGEHRTDVSNASRTLLMNIKTCEWDDSLLKIFGIPREVLPEILPSAVEYGTTRGFLSFPDGIPVAAMSGDQQSALFGQMCLNPGEAKCTYGTGAFLLLNTGDKPVFSKHRLLTTVAWKIGKKVTYGLEGSSFIAGASVQWLRDGLHMIRKSSEVESLAAEVKDSDGVIFVPSLTGMGAPHWISTATGLITGITRRTTKAHIARATLEGVAFQVTDLFQAMQKDLKKPLKKVRVDGGASANNILMQFQSDMLNTQVERPKNLETTALGAGLQAGLAVGYWKNIDHIKKLWKKDRVFDPVMAKKEKEQRYSKWQKAVKAVELLSE